MPGSARAALVMRFLNAAVEAVVEAVGVQEGVEVGADLDGQGTGGKPGDSFQQGELRCGLVGDVGRFGLDDAASGLGIGMPGAGELMGGDGGERRIGAMMNARWTRQARPASNRA